MKKNLTLFAVFVFLLGVTYVYQEKRVETEHLENEVKDKVFTDEIQQLKLGGVSAQKKGEQWWAGTVLLSHNSLKQIETKLSQIKKVKDIEGEYKNFFTAPFVFEVNRVEWSIGDLSLDKQSFYLAKENRIMLAVVEGDSHELTEDASQIASIKLGELLGQLKKPLGELREKQLFRFYPHLPAARVVIEAEGNLPYELNFLKNTTTPAPIPGIPVHEKLQGKFISLLTQMTLREEIPFNPKLMFKKLGSMTFLDEKGSVKWEIWLKDEKSADAYLIDSVHKKAFLMVGGTLKVFFIHLQDYWDKKNIPPREFKHFIRLSTRFTQGAKSAEVTVLNKEPLAFEIKGHQAVSGTLEGLFQIVFNLGQRDQAERVSILSKTDKQQVLGQERLKIEVMGQELIIWKKAEELIVVNMTQGFKAHYNLLDEKFSGTFDDVLK
ncbi:MAG TPA: hypothetical protein VNJ01_06775 [Bacteriovoracaceae bacterium]|nr:hypothetical protein [Bacteriovoracaceae bacterium]